MSRLLIRNARLVNEGRIFDADCWSPMAASRRSPAASKAETPPLAIDAKGQWLLPGMIDDQVHFRDPGAPDKGSFYSESRAAVAGGITSFMDMPNTNPATLNLEALADKKRRAAMQLGGQLRLSLRGEQRQPRHRRRPRPVRGGRGQSVHGRLHRQHAGGRPTDSRAAVCRSADHPPGPLRTHAEHPGQRAAICASCFGDDIPAAAHPLIRDAEACYRSSSLAVELAKRHGTRLHVLHLTTRPRTGVVRRQTRWPKTHHR